MILSSYKTEFDSNFKYHIFQITKRLSKYKKIQILILGIIIRISPDNKLMALLCYINGINYIDNKINISNFTIKRDEEFYNKNLDIYDLFYINYKNKNRKKIENIIKENYYTNVSYVVERSGFFSTIFTVVIISYFCNKNNINLHINWRNWPYKFDISQFFFCANESEGISIESGQGHLFSLSREYINMLDDGKEGLEDYFSYRYQILKKIYIWAKSNKILELMEANLNLEDITTCFIRRGDKLLHEGYPLTVANYRKTLSQYENVLIIGDDYYFNENLCKSTNFQHSYIPGYTPKGAYLSQMTVNSVNAILLNLCILVDSKYIIGDPYCNLFAAALILRGENYSKDRILHPWKLRNFI